MSRLDAIGVDRIDQKRDNVLPAAMVTLKCAAQVAAVSASECFENLPGFGFRGVKYEVLELLHRA
jgi:hypothetical protein